jgi:hypothetical protein
MNIKLMLIIFLTCFGCNQTSKKTDPSDDYVLVEFAARLEEDQEKFFPKSEQIKKTHQLDE